MQWDKARQVVIPGIGLIVLGALAWKGVISPQVLLAMFAGWLAPSPITASGTAVKEEEKTK